MKNQSGFTLTEIIVALLIMMIGFLATSQMQYLSIKQHSMAEDGTVGTNYLQALSERDMSEVRRIHLLNSRVYLDRQQGKVIGTQDDYCTGSIEPCDSGCPCNPLLVLTSAPNSDNTETSCAEIDLGSVDPSDIVYETNKSNCTGVELYIVRRVVTDFDATVNPNIVNINVTYAVKNRDQFEDYTFGDPLTLAKSVLVQNYEASAHIDDWSNYVAGWTQVTVPHVP